MEEDYSGDPRLSDYPEVQMTHAAAEPLDTLRKGRGGGGGAVWPEPPDSARGKGGTVFSDGRVYLPLHASERTFYELLGLHGAPSSGLLAAHDGAMAPKLGDFCPAYYGVRTAEQAGIAPDGGSLSRIYIELEDVCANLRQPITCKLRMGTRGAWALESEGRRTARLAHKERASLWREDLRRTSGSLGWLMAEAPSASSTESAKGLEDLGDEAALRRFTNFLALAGPKRAERVAAAFLQQTQSILRWFRSPKRRTKFYGSSLLFAFEGERDELETGEDPVALVRMVGFAYTTPMQEPVADGSGYVVGLLALSAMLRALSQPGVLYGADALAEQPSAGLRQDPVLHDNRPRGGAVIYAVVRCKFCLLLETSTKGDDWVLPKGKFLPGESLEDAGRRLAKSEAGVADFEVEAEVATRVLVKADAQGGGAVLRRYAFVFGTSTGRLEQTKVEVPAEALVAPPAAAAQWAPWKESERSVPRMRAWVPLERVTGLVKQQWALCVVQAAWQRLLDARSRAVADAEHHRAIWEEEEAVEIASLQEMQSQWIPI